MALLIACSSRGDEFAAVARSLDPDLDVRVAPDIGDPAEVHYALAWWPQPGLLKTLPNLRLIVSVGAGVDHLFSDPTFPTCRSCASSTPTLRAAWSSTSRCTCSTTTGA